MSEQQVFAKCAWRLIPFLGLLYFFNFLDRLNAGYAALTMNRDLGFSPTVFGFGAGALFAGQSLQPLDQPGALGLERERSVAGDWRKVSANLRNGLP